MNRKMLNEILNSRTYKYVNVIGLLDAFSILVGACMLLFPVIDSLTGTNSFSAAGGAMAMSILFLFSIVVTPITLLLSIVIPILLIVDLLKPPSSEYQKDSFMPVWLQAVCLCSYFTVTGFIAKIFIF